MENNEIEMKAKGVTKVYKDIVTKAGNNKNVSSTQIGQQMLFDEALKLTPTIREWIEKKAGTKNKKAFRDYFKDDEFLLTKITQTLLFLSGSIYDFSNGFFLFMVKVS